MNHINVTISKEVVHEVDACVTAKRFRSRSHAFEELIKKGIRKYQEEAGFDGFP